MLSQFLNKHQQIQQQFFNKQKDDVPKSSSQTQSLNSSNIPSKEHEGSLIFSSNESKSIIDSSLRGGDNKRSRLFQDNLNYQPQQLSGFEIEANDVIPTIEMNDQEQLEEVAIKLDILCDDNEDYNDEQIDIVEMKQEQVNVQQARTPFVMSNAMISTVAASKVLDIDLNSPTKRQCAQQKNSIPSFPLLQTNRRDNFKGINSELIDQSQSLPYSIVKGKKPLFYESQHSFFKLIFLINRLLFTFKKILLYFHPEKLNSFQLALIGDLAAQNYEQDGYGVPYLIQYEHHTKASSNHKSSLFNQELRSSHYISCNLKADYQRQKRRKRMRYLYKKISKYLGFNYFSRAYTKLKHNLRRLARFTVDKIPLIDPNSNFFYIWQVLILLNDTMIMIYTPFQASFTQISLIEDYFIKIIFPIVYIMNVVINMNVSVYDKGVLITSRYKIIQLYLLYSFFFDLIAVLAAFTYQILLIVRFFYTNPLIEQLKSYFLLNSNLNAVFQFVSLVIKIFIFSHIFSCIWHSIGVYYAQENQGWMSFFFYQDDKDIVSIYITCFYYAVVTMSTIGYGDIYAKTTGEMVFMIFSIFIACGLFGYTLNSIDLKQKNENYSKKQAQLEEYLSRHQVDIGLRNRARKYIQYVYQEENMFKKDGQENMKLLNSYLKQEIQKDINKRALNKAKRVFSNISSNSKFFDKILTIIKEQQYGPEELISISNQSQNPAIYIIQYGEVEQFIKNRDNLTPFKLIQVSISLYFNTEQITNKREDYGSYTFY